MSRTLRATIVAGVTVAATVAGLGVLLGFGVTGSLVSGVAFGTAMGILIWLAARRAETFHEPSGSPDVDGGLPPSPDERADPRT